MALTSRSSFGCAVLLAMLAIPAAGQYRVVSLTGDITDLGHFIPKPDHLDGHLRNAWGLAFLPGSPFWVSDELTGFSTLYKGDGTMLPLVVTIPKAPSDPLPPGSPTGLVGNPYGGFVISHGGKSGSSFFIFDTLDGTISGWNPTVNATEAVIAVDNAKKGAAYTGLAIAHTSKGTWLYAANAALNQIEKYDSNFDLVTTFRDTNIPPPFGVYGVAVVEGDVYVTFAPILPGKPGAGYLDVFDAEGKLIRTLVSASPNGHLNIPWAVVLAPRNFGKFSGALLVGNVQDGRISAFNKQTGEFLGYLSDRDEKPIEIPGLWALAVTGGSGTSGKPNELYLTAGPGTYYDGLFAKIVVDTR